MIIKLFIFLFIFTSIKSYAQVNIESIRPKTDTQSTQSLDLSWNIDHSDESNSDLTIEYNSFLKNNVNDQLLIVTNYKNKFNNNHSYFSKSFVHLRFITSSQNNIPVSEWFIQNEFSSYSTYYHSRFIYGVGLRNQLYKNKLFEVYFGTGVLKEYELFKNKYSNIDRISSYLSVKWKPISSSTLSFVQYIQPSIQTFSDYKLLSDLVISVDLLHNIQFKSTLSYMYNNNPFESQKKSQLTAKQGLKFLF